MLFAYDSIAATQKLGRPLDTLVQTLVLYTVQLQLCLTLLLPKEIVSQF